MSSDETKKAILARRARFLAAALASAGISSVGLQGCGGTAQVCLDPAPTDASVDGDGPQVCLGANNDAESEAQVCLSVEYDASEDVPQPCLDVPPDAETEAQVCLGVAADASEDVPQPCLEMPMDAQVCLSAPYDGGEDAPQACLKAPFDAGDDAPQPCLDVPYKA